MIKKNEDGLYDIICDFCEDTQAELSGDASFDTFKEAVEFKKERPEQWHSVKDNSRKDGKWFDLCQCCYSDKKLVDSFRNGQRESSIE